MSFIGQKSGALSNEGDSSALIEGLQAAIGHLAQAGCFTFANYHLFNYLFTQ
jgi:hypothetical protein